ncbi:hypothetical protein [Pseudomonas qingdaonensis]|uniref:hypothetical protein n=1 Tax=Pseudomonas qingdaonensis TaxID=2056231 RepID=UPI001F1BEBCA|nr:hypothetical protein [Pseudomonas qingdaonensis]
MRSRALSGFCCALTLSALPNLALAQATVAQVFNGEMLGTNLRFFESVAGVARTSFGDTHTYKVQGCEITATAGGGTVSELRMELSPTCKADLSTFIGDFAPPAAQPLTFGAMAGSSGGGLEFYASCLSMCGNAADPSVYALWQGPRAVGFTEVLLEVVLVDDEASAAAGHWSEAMQKAKGDDFVMDTRFNCERTFDEVAQASFDKVKVNAVTIGTELTKPGC